MNNIASSFACRDCGIQSFPYLGNDKQCVQCHLKQALSVIKLYAIEGQQELYCNCCCRFLTTRFKGHKAGCAVYETIKGEYLNG